MSVNIREETKEQQNSVNTRLNFILERLIREKYGTKQAIADKIGWTRPLISQIVHGHTKSTTTQKIKIAKALEVDSRTIWGENE